MSCGFPVDCWTIVQMGPNEILRQCILEHEKPIILNEAHDSVTGGHMLVKLQYEIYYKQDRGVLL